MFRHLSVLPVLWLYFSAPKHSFALPLAEVLPNDGEEEIGITTERLSERPIDEKQGGQFIEPLCGLIPSMLAQQVANTSFAVEPPWKVAFRRETDKPYR